MNHSPFVLSVSRIFKLLRIYSSGGCCGAPLLLSPRCRRRRARRRSLAVRTVKPIFEARLAKLGRIVRHNAALAQLSAKILRVWISDDFARIVEYADSFPDEFIKSEHFGPGNFNCAV